MTKLTLNDSHVKTIQDIKYVIKSKSRVDLKICSRREAYGWIESTLVKFEYGAQGKKNKGWIRKYIKKLTGYSKSQVTKLISKYLKTGYVRAETYKRNKFHTKYSPDDIILLAEVERLNLFPSGAIVKTILERQFEIFGDERYENLSQISVSHIYNLRESQIYQNATVKYKKTNPTKNNFGKRKKPNPEGMPGFIRIDTVHQGDLKDKKGVYHINAVDEITQYQLVVAVENISKIYLTPVIEILIKTFPFEIINFHSDNGGEYINDLVAKLLDGLNIEFTKSRPRKSTDNGLVEGKNPIIRKHMGYHYIPQKYAEEINKFYDPYFNNYLNFHKPCLFPSISIDKKGKEVKKYLQKDCTTPYEKLKSLKNAEQYLREGITFEKLDKIAYAHSDIEYAEIVERERSKLFTKLKHLSSLPYSSS